jgi:hypothetical protein
MRRIDRILILFVENPSQLNLAANRGVTAVIAAATNNRRASI